MYMIVLSNPRILTDISMLPEISPSLPRGQTLLDHGQEATAGPQRGPPGSSPRNVEKLGRQYHLYNISIYYPVSLLIIYINIIPLYIIPLENEIIKVFISIQYIIPLYIIFWIIIYAIQRKQLQKKEIIMVFIQFCHFVHS